MVVSTSSTSQGMTMTYLLLGAVVRKAPSLLRLTNWLPDPAAQSGDRLLHAADQPRYVHAHELAPALPEHAVHQDGVDVPWLRRQDNLPSGDVQRRDVERVGPQQDQGPPSCPA